MRPRIGLTAALVSGLALGISACSSTTSAPTPITTTQQAAPSLAASNSCGAGGSNLPTEIQRLQNDCNEIESHNGGSPKVSNNDCDHYVDDYDKVLAGNPTLVPSLYNLPNDAPACDEPVG